MNLELKAAKWNSAIINFVYICAFPIVTYLNVFSGNSYSGSQKSTQCCMNPSEPHPREHRNQGGKVESEAQVLTYLLLRYLQHLCIQDGQLKDQMDAAKPEITSFIPQHSCRNWYCNVTSFVAQVPLCNLPVFDQSRLMGLSFCAGKCPTSRGRAIFHIWNSTFWRRFIYLTLNLFMDISSLLKLQSHVSTC